MVLIHGEGGVGGTSPLLQKCRKGVRGVPDPGTLGGYPPVSARGRDGGIRRGSTGTNRCSAWRRGVGCPAEPGEGVPPTPPPPKIKEGFGIPAHPLLLDCIFARYPIGVSCSCSGNSGKKNHTGPVHPNGSCTVIHGTFRKCASSVMIVRTACSSMVAARSASQK